MNKAFALLLSTFLILTTASSVNFEENFTQNVTDDLGEHVYPSHCVDYYGDLGQRRESAQWNISYESDEGEIQDVGEYQASIYQFDNGEYYVRGFYDRNIYTSEYVNGRYESDKLNEYGGYCQGGQISNFNEVSTPKYLGLPQAVKKIKKQLE